MTIRILRAIDNTWLQEDRATMWPSIYGAADLGTVQAAQDFIADPSHGLADDASVYVMDDGEGPDVLPDERPLFDAEGRPVGGSVLAPAVEVEEGVHIDPSAPLDDLSPRGPSQES